MPQQRTAQSSSHQHSQWSQPQQGFQNGAPHPTHQQSPQQASFTSSHPIRMTNPGISGSSSAPGSWDLPSRASNGKYILTTLMSRFLRLYPSFSCEPRLQYLSFRQHDEKTGFSPPWHFQSESNVFISSLDHCSGPACLYSGRLLERQSSRFASHYERYL